jgi:hypothetical protein
MKTSKERTSSIKFLIGTVAFLWVAVSNCGRMNSAPVDSYEANDSKSSEDSESPFDSYLSLFSDERPLDTWDTKGQYPLVQNDVIFMSNTDPLRKILQSEYRAIPMKLRCFIPLRQIIHLDYRDKSDVPNPYRAFEFYAFTKQEHQNYWLVSIFAYMREMVNEVYYQHPFIFATYSKDGILLDDFVWWSIIAEDVQIWDDVQVVGDTFMVGSKGGAMSDRLTEIYEKMVITDDGYFEIVYDNYVPGDARVFWNR